MKHNPVIGTWECERCMVINPHNAGACVRCGYGRLLPSDEVKAPAHYTKGKIQPIAFIEDQKLDFLLGNVIKYVCRAKHKGNEKQDIEKAIWYLARYKENMPNEN